MLETDLRQGFRHAAVCAPPFASMWFGIVFVFLGMLPSSRTMVQRTIHHILSGGSPSRINRIRSITVHDSGLRKIVQTYQRY